MKIEFQITSIPNENQKQYLIAYVEGMLNIFLKGRLFFHSSDILIAELGVSLKKWLDNIKKSGQLSSFKYESMDSDDNPIISFKYDGKGGFIAMSPWQEVEAIESVGQNELLREVEDFLKKLDIKLKEMCNMKLENFIE